MRDGKSFMHELGEAMGHAVLLSAAVKELLDRVPAENIPSRLRRTLHTETAQFEKHRQAAGLE